MVWRVTDAKSPGTLNAYRAGYNALWKHAKRKLRAIGTAEQKSGE